MNRTTVARSVRQRQLTRRQEHALTALMQHGIIAEAARASNVPESTLRRWLRTDARFVRAYRDMRRKVTETANAILQVAGEEAADKLVKLMRDDSLPANVRLAVLVQVLDRSAASELEQRIEELESRQIIVDAEPKAERLRAV